MDIKLNGGVLLIGSLFWQDFLYKKDDDIRKNWRNIYLNMEHVLDVSIPIRYGRFSSNDQTYTMIFDYKLPFEKYGIAKAIPFKQTNLSVENIIQNAKDMSFAEGKYDRTLIKGKKQPAWGVCGICFNPNILSIVKKELLEVWTLALEENKVGYEAFIQKSNIYSLSPDGEFLFDFPMEAKGLDFLVAISTKPKLREGVLKLDAEEIAKYATNRDYVQPNINNGITTFQDETILNALNERI
ncbi:MAG: hypothetical protein N4A74_01460 [Carboxylicivirga sp.]|jgi:hypothetical protein|nr:hypothetical protein [Carboxylicivirga sp.]